MEEERTINQQAGFPELTELGKRIEMLRIERGLSKQHLARHAGTSRQQLWRVMTGKSELTGSLRGRLVEVLQSTSLDAVAPSAAPVVSPRSYDVATYDVATYDVASYVAEVAAIRRTLATLPRGDGGRVLKRRLLDAIEDHALDARISLGGDFFELRRQVLAGEL